MSKARSLLEYGRHTGDNRRFHVRVYNGGKYQVYGVGLHHVCECEVVEVADMIADTLEAAAEREEKVLKMKPTEVALETCPNCHEPTWDGSRCIVCGHTPCIGGGYDGYEYK